MSRTRLLHLSDTHLMAPGGLHQGLVDTRAQLELLLTGLDGLGPLDAVIVSGDVSDDGSPASYATVSAMVEAFAAPRGARVVWAMGNHDTRGSFAATLLGRPDADPAEPLDAVHDIEGLRVVVLDSSVPGKGYGRMEDGQLRRLREVLAAPAPRGTVVVVHHPPLPAPTVLHEGLALRDPHTLLGALEGSDVRAVLSGHYHYPAVARVGRMSVVVAPGVANRTDVLVARGQERVVRGSGACLVDLTEDGVLTTVITVTVPEDGQELVLLDEATVAQIVADSGYCTSDPALHVESPVLGP